MDVNVNLREQEFGRIYAQIVDVSTRISALGPRSPEAQALFPLLDRLIAEKDAILHG